MNILKKLSRAHFCTNQPKNIFFRFNNIEYKAIIPSGTKRTVLDFLDLFGKERGNLSSKDFEMVKGDKYIPNTALINEIETKTMEENPLTILEDKFTTRNIKFRKLASLKDPLNNHCAKFQSFLNEFIHTSNTKLDIIDPESILRYYKTVGKVKSTNPKFFNLLTIILKNLDLKYEYDYNLEFGEFNKRHEKGLYMIKSKNGLQIPITMVLEKDDSNLNKDSEFNEYALYNLNLLRKLSMKNKAETTLGIVTDLNRWKFTLYQRPSDKYALESDNNYKLSLQYELPINNTHLNTNALAYMLKIINGITTIDQEMIKGFENDKKHIQ